MKKILLFVAILFLEFNVFAQAGEWTWMKGDKLPNSQGFFGTQGIPDSSNKPPNLSGAAAWKDRNGDLWLFGGYYPEMGEYSSALWKYDIVLNEWIWMKGDSTFNHYPVYGIMGIPSATNDPGGRSWMINTWVDSSGIFWMFGGSASYVPINDEVWKYDPSTNEWTWMKGQHQPAFFGTKGIDSPANNPGNRNSTINCYDGGKGLWLYGGITFTGRYDDLWKYDITTNDWVWMWGDSTFNQPIVYGTKGVEDSLNNPGSRYGSGCWKDEQGNFFLFAGASSVGGQNVLNDVWRYSLSSNKWTWIDGMSYGNAAAVSGAQCEADTSFIPVSRVINKNFWQDGCHNFWVFGGLHFTSNFYNDLWTYSTSSNNWAWVSGSLVMGQAGTYGTKGLPDPANVPGARTDAVCWIDNTGNLWLFGGSRGYYFFNDLWKYTVDTLCPTQHACSYFFLPQTAFTSNSNSGCTTACFNFTDSSKNATSYQWFFQGGTPSSSFDQNPTNICYNAPGTYDVTLITSNANGSDTLTLQNYITVNAAPANPTITQNGTTLTSSLAASYQWQFNSVNIAGATNQSYIATQSGFYTVIVSDSNGCKNSATKKFALISGVNEINDDAGVFISPNPSSGNFTVEFNAPITGNVSIDVVNSLGQKVFSVTGNISSTDLKREIDLSAVSKGIYFLELRSKDELVRKKIVIVQ